MTKLRDCSIFNSRFFRQVPANFRPAGISHQVLQRYIGEAGPPVHAKPSQSLQYVVVVSLVGVAIRLFHKFQTLFSCPLTTSHLSISPPLHSHKIRHATRPRPLPPPLPPSLSSFPLFTRLIFLPYTLPFVSLTSTLLSCPLPFHPSLSPSHPINKIFKSIKATTTTNTTTTTTMTTTTSTVTTFSIAIPVPLYHCHYDHQSL